MQREKNRLYTPELLFSLRTDLNKFSWYSIYLFQQWILYLFHEFLFFDKYLIIGLFNSLLLLNQTLINSILYSY